MGTGSRWLWQSTAELGQKLMVCVCVCAHVGAHVCACVRTPVRSCEGTQVLWHADEGQKTTHASYHLSPSGKHPYSLSHLASPW